MTDSNFVNAISTKALGLVKEAVMEILKTANGKEIEVAEIIGMVTGSKVKEGNTGPYTMFDGNFEGVNKLTGAVVTSGGLMLPPFVESMVKAHIAGTDFKKGEVAPIGLVVTVKLEHKEATAEKAAQTYYNFGAKWALAKGATRDPLANLRAQVRGETMDGPWEEETEGAGAGKGKGKGKGK